MKKKKMKNPCWKGFIAYGMKKGKGGKMVPNCVPKKKKLAKAELDYHHSKIQEKPFSQVGWKGTRKHKWDTFNTHRE